MDIYHGRHWEAFQQTQWRWRHDVASSLSLQTKNLRQRFASRKSAVIHYRLPPLSPAGRRRHRSQEVQPLSRPCLLKFSAVTDRVSTHGPRFNSKMYCPIQHTLCSYCGHLNIGTLSFYRHVIRSIRSNKNGPNRYFVYELLEILYLSKLFQLADVFVLAWSICYVMLASSPAKCPR